MNITIRKIGNSEGVILPKELLRRYKLKAGDVVNLVDEGDKMSLQPSEDAFERQMREARKIMDRYSVALQKLAE